MRLDARGGESGGGEPGTVGRGEVEEGPPRAPRPQEIGRELVRDLGSDLVATRPDGRTQPGADVRRLFAELGKRGDGGAGDVPDGAAPAGMGGGDGRFPREEDRNAIRRLNGERHGRKTRGQDVALARVGDFPLARRLSNGEDTPAVNLGGAHDRHPVRRERVGEAASQIRGGRRFVGRRGSAAGKRHEKPGPRARGLEEEKPIAPLRNPILAHASILRTMEVSTDHRSPRGAAA